MNSTISDVALDLGAFALDREIENSPTLEIYPAGDQAWNSSAARDQIDTERFAVCS